jgi:predicted nucleotidyltransferase
MNLQHQIAQQLARYLQIKLGILFGTLARSQAKIDSDHDFAIAADRTLGIDDKMALIKGLAQLAPRPLDLVNLQTAGGSFLQEILTKYIVLNTTRALELCVDIAAHIVAETEQRVLDTRFGMSSARPAGYR